LPSIAWRRTTRRAAPRPREEPRISADLRPCDGSAPRGSTVGATFPNVGPQAARAPRRLERVGIDFRPAGRFVVLFDGQCEVCQAGVAWIRQLDRDQLVDCVALESADLSSLHAELRVEECLRELHVVTPLGDVVRGWAAVVALTRLFPATRLLADADEWSPVHALGTRAYEWVAANRYQLSKCRGGACHVSNPREIRRRSSLAPFWSCYGLGMLPRGPLVAAAAVRSQSRYVADWARTYRRRVDLLDETLSLCFLGGGLSDVVPVVFGERFAMMCTRVLPSIRARRECGRRCSGTSTRSAPARSLLWRQRISTKNTSGISPGSRSAREHRSISRPRPAPRSCGPRRDPTARRGRAMVTGGRDRRHRRVPVRQHRR